MGARGAANEDAGRIQGKHRRLGQKTNERTAILEGLREGMVRNGWAAGYGGSHLKSQDLGDGMRRILTLRSTCVT